MKLVSTVKLQKAKGRAEQTDPYFQYMYRTVSSILAHSGNMDHPSLRSGESKKKAIVVLTSSWTCRGYDGSVVSGACVFFSGSPCFELFAPYTGKFRKNLFHYRFRLKEIFSPILTRQIGIFLFQALIDLAKIEESDNFIVFLDIFQNAVQICFICIAKKV